MTEAKMPVKKIRLYPLADESLGVRSMALYVETPDVGIVFDPGVSLAPRRFGLPPHPSEFKAVKEARKTILGFVKRADIVTVSHFHLDHYTPNFVSWYEWTNKEIHEAIYTDKIVLVKNPKKDINYNQAKRAKAFLASVENLAEKIVIGEGANIKLGNTVIKGLGPLPHGSENTKLGYVVAFLVEYEDEKIIFAPDVQGPISNSALNALLGVKPSLVVVGGPPVYLEAVKLSREDVERGINNLRSLIAKSNVIVSHHLLRVADWKKYVGEDAKILTYADVRGLEETLLEAFRKDLYEYEPPSEEFQAWIREKKKGEPPPI
ncbi:MAG TPA: hypothetical protein ENJ59_00120 [Thermofilum sp.]|nr:hypothetical protein [Thermofilum sp.]